MFDAFESAMLDTYGILNIAVSLREDLAIPGTHSFLQENFRNIAETLEEFRTL